MFELQHVQIHVYMYCTTTKQQIGLYLIVIIFGEAGQRDIFWGTFIYKMGVGEVRKSVFKHFSC